MDESTLYILLDELANGIVIAAAVWVMAYLVLRVILSISHFLYDAVEQANEMLLRKKRCSMDHGRVANFSYFNIPVP